MRIKRYKKAYKCLGFYINNFGFRRPFQLLIDGTFCFAAVQNRIQIKEDVPKYLGNELKFLTTPCIVLETEKLGPKLVGVSKIIKSFGIHNCNHGKNPKSGSDCLYSMVRNNNPSRYVIATQDKDLQTKLQNIPAVPILYINRTSVILKSPSESSIALANDKKVSALGLNDYQQRFLDNIQRENPSLKPQSEPTEICRKPKGPNPLSCKRKRPKVEAPDEPTDIAESKSTKRKKRKRIKLPEHVKRELTAARN